MVASMAFKFILGHHVRTILNDVQDKHKKDIKDYAGGHLNESVILRTPLSLTRKSWASAYKENNRLAKSFRSEHKLQLRNAQDTVTDALYNSALSTSEVIPDNHDNIYKSKGIHCRLLTESQTEKEGRKLSGSRTPRSIYSDLDDGVFVQELPLLEIRIPQPHFQPPVFENNKSDDELSAAEEGKLNSQHSFSKRANFESSSSHSCSMLPRHAYGITKKDQYRKMKDSDLTKLQKKELYGQKTAAGKITAAAYHGQKLGQELGALSIAEDIPSFHRLQMLSHVLDDVASEPYTFSYMLHCIKTEYDNYISKLLDSQMHQQHHFYSQTSQLTPQIMPQQDELAAVTSKLKSVEVKAKNALDINERLYQQVKSEQENINKTPELPGTKKLVTEIGAAHKEQPVELSTELENMKALILEKLDELNSLRQKSRHDHVPVTVCTHLEQCIKETEVEVQKLLKQNEYFQRSIAEMESDLHAAIIEADTSEKDARRIWHKVNSKQRMPGTLSAAGTESGEDDDDDESKWNWYIS